MKERIAIVPGSFDPITNGHINIIERATQMYDKVYVAVMINAQKKYMFTLEERKEIAAACFRGRENVEVISSDGWLWKLAKDIGACAIVKGYRNNVDLEYEKNMAKFNEEHYPEAKTILLKSAEGLGDLSSTEVRECIKKRVSIDGLIPQEAIDIIKKL